MAQAQDPTVIVTNELGGMVRTRSAVRSCYLALCANELREEGLPPSRLPAHILFFLLRPIAFMFAWAWVCSSFMGRSVNRVFPRGLMEW